MSNNFARFIRLTGLAAAVCWVIGARPGVAAVKLIGDFETSAITSPYPNAWQTLGGDPDFTRVIDKNNLADATFAAGVTHGNGAILITHPQTWSGGPYLRLNAGAPLLDDTATYPYLLYDVTTFGGASTPDEGPTFRQIFNIFNGPTVSGAYNFPGFFDANSDPDVQNTLNRGDGRDEIAGFGDASFTFTEVLDMTAPDPGTFPAPADGKVPINIKSQQLRTDNNDGTPLDPFYWQLYFAFQGDDSPPTAKVQIVIDNIRFCTGNTAAACQVPTDLPGDYNGDGRVDAADYVMWRKNLGSGTSLPHGDDTTGVGNDDYTRWRSNFGSSTFGVGADLGSSSGVPEPSSVLLLLMGLMTAPLCRRVRS